MTWLLALALFVAVVSAARSTWSPCGISMLSTITPLSERSRQHRYGATAAWFVLGAVAGGAALGASFAAGAALLSLLGPGPTAVAVVAAGAAALAVLSDLRVAGWSLPAHRRQVDEVWLTGFRPWVYGIGFGAQIGVGLATYITTATVYLLGVLAILTQQPGAAFLCGIVFGTVRGLAVLLGARLHSPAALRAFHARLAAWDPIAADVTVLAAIGVLVAATVTLSVPLAGIAGVGAVLAWATSWSSRRERAGQARVARV